MNDYLRTPKSDRPLLLAGFLLAGLIGVLLHLVPSSSEPEYQGRRLSVLLDELRALNYSVRPDPRKQQVQAVRAIGTNAIPWLLTELESKGNRWYWQLNRVLQKQQLIKYRFPDVNKRLARATLGFQVLGELAEPAIPRLLDLLQSRPGYIPSALAGIGAPALPALARCLTNATSSVASRACQVIPGNTIVALQSAIGAQRISAQQIDFLLPAIWDRAQSTNKDAALFAPMFLEGF